MPTNMEELRTEYRAWADFPSLPGIRVVWHRQAKSTYELVADGTRVATVRVSWNGVSALSIDLGGRKIDYVQRNVDAVRWRDRIRCLAEPEATEPSYTTTGGHLDHRDSGTITLRGGAVFRFPVQGNRKTTAIMRAVDAKGQTQLHYRFGDSSRALKGSWHTNMDSAEVVINPECRLPMESILLLIAVSSEWLATYFKYSGGGG